MAAGCNARAMTNLVPVVRERSIWQRGHDSTEPFMRWVLAPKHILIVPLQELPCRPPIPVLRQRHRLSMQGIVFLAIVKLVFYTIADLDPVFWRHRHIAAIKQGMEILP